MLWGFRILESHKYWNFIQLHLCTFKMASIPQQLGAGVARGAHNPEVTRSKRVVAIKLYNISFALQSTATSSSEYWFYLPAAFASKHHLNGIVR